MIIGNKEILNSYIVISTVVLLAVLAAVLFLAFRGGSQESGGRADDDSFFGFLFGGEPSAVPAPSGPPGAPGIITGSEEDPDQMLFQVSSDPVAGAIVSPGAERVRYFKRATGHVFENTFQGAEEIRISNVTIPAIQTVQWTPSREYAIIAHYADGALEHVYTRYSGTTSIESAFLPGEIDAIAVSPANTISYTIRSDGETALFTANPDNTNIKNIFTTPIGDVELQWPAANRISVKTKSSAFTGSFLFTLNPATKRFVRIIADTEGLDTLWSPSGADVLYMETADEGTRITLRVLSIEEGTETEIPIATLPEKCAWAPASSQRVLYCGVPQPIPSRAHMPDDWWQGTVSFNDTLWRINVDTGEQQQLLPVRPFDITNMFLTEDESFLFFTNKKDGSLWSLSLGS